VSKTLALIRHELAAYFVTPAAYVVLTVYLVLCGVKFSADVAQAGGLTGEGHMPLSFAGTFQFISQLAFLITPLVTMRLIAEEKSRGTLEALMTTPVSDLQVVLSKFAGALIFFSFLLMPTLAYVAIVRAYAPLDWTATLTGYAGLLLFLAYLTGIGLFISSLCNSQMVAAVVTLVLMMGLLLVSLFAPGLKPDTWGWALLSALNLAARSGNFALGVVDTRDLVFFGSGILYFLFGTSLVMESRRWR
jgi:ABC-2 type transport system permease protein